MSKQPKKTWPPQILDPESVKAAAEATLRHGGFEERLAQEREEALRKLEPGRAFENEGIFVGTWEPQGLGKIFNVFAAPEDLTDVSGKRAPFSFDEAVERVATLKDWHGFNGGSYANDKEVYDALKEGRYKGEWFIPTRDLLVNNLHNHQNTAELKGTFNQDITGFGRGDFYLSCTFSQHAPDCVKIGQLSAGAGGSTPRSNRSMVCRLVRVVEVLP